MFEEGHEEEAAEGEAERIEAEEDQRTMLTAYFELNNRIGQAEASKYTYETINRDYYYCQRTKEWCQRQNKITNHIYRLGTVGATNIEAQVNIIVIFFTIYLFYIQGIENGSSACARSYGLGRCDRARWKVPY